MTTRYATPMSTQAEIQAWLDARDYVVLSAGSQYNLLVDQHANDALGWRVPGGATLDINGAIVCLAGVLNQLGDGAAVAAIGCTAGPCGVIRNGVIRAPDDRVVPGQVRNHGNALLNFRAVGVRADGLIEDVILLNGPNQAVKLNDVVGMTMRRVRTPCPTVAPTASGLYLGHYVDLDVTAKGRYTEDVLFDDCDLDAFGQECLKLENVRRIRFLGTRFRNKVTLVQDDSPYSALDEIEFDAGCVFHSYLSMSNLRRRWNGAGYDNLGGGRVTIRGRMIGDDALILGNLKSPGVDGTEAEQFANVRADAVTFEGCNSHLVPLPDSSWITNSVGVKQRVTIYVRDRSDPRYPFGVVPCVVAGNVGANTGLIAAVQNSLAARFVAAYNLDKRGVRVSVASGTWTGSRNLGRWPSLDQNVPVDFIGEGGSEATILDAQDTTSSCLSVYGSNNQRVRFFGFTLRRSKAGTSSRGWLINSAAANVEFYDVVSEDCSCLNGGAGGRAQNYASIVLGPGTRATGCHALGASNGGGFLIDLSSPGSCVIEGVRADNCSAGGQGGGLRVNSLGCRIRSLELLGNASSGGAGGLAISVSSATGTASVSGVSGRGNVGALGQGGDIGIYAGNAAGKIIVRSSILGSGGLVLSKSGTGTLEYGDLNCGASGAISASGGVNRNLGNVQNADPKFVAEQNSVALAGGSQARAAAAPQWNAGVERAPACATGDWFEIAKNGMTTMGARP